MDIQNNKSSALVALNTMTIVKDEVIKINYYTESGAIDSLVAIGTKSGVGPFCYTLISDQTIPCITSILDYRPDVSDMISGAIYLFNDPKSNDYLIFYEIDGDFHEEEITENFYFTNLEDGMYYYFDSTKGAQKIINISKNLSEKSSFQGIINVTREGYQELLDKNEIMDDIIYLINDGTYVMGLYYNYMSFELALDPGDNIRERVKALEEKVDDGLYWIE